MGSGREGSGFSVGHCFQAEPFGDLSRSHCSRAVARRQCHPATGDRRMVGWPPFEKCALASDSYCQVFSGRPGLSTVAQPPPAVSEELRVARGWRPSPETATAAHLQLFTLNSLLDARPARAAPSRSADVRISGQEVPGRLPHVFGPVKEVFGRARDVFGRAKEVFGRAKEVLGQAEDVFGRAKEVFGRVKEAPGSAKDAFGRSKEAII